MSSSNDEQSMISSFLEVAQGQTVQTARQFLQATNWKLEEALQLFLIGNEAGAVLSSSHTPPLENNDSFIDQPESESSGSNDGEEEVRPPLPFIRETLDDNEMLYRASQNSQEESRQQGVWESEQYSVSMAESSQDNLASLYRLPFHLMFSGSFDKAKVAASVADKWLLVNVQSTTEFSSHMLNRDTWSNEAVSQTISTNFLFWQVYDDAIEGKKVCTFYRQESVPVVLILDPITGQKMHSWSGMVEPKRLLEGLVPFLDAGPKDYHITLSKKRPRARSSPTKTKGVRGVVHIFSESSGSNDGEEEVRPPLPVIRETLNDNEMLYRASQNSQEESRQQGVWESEQDSVSMAESSQDNLASLYRPPFHLMFSGSFDKAKVAASVTDKWILVNVQSTTEFSSHMLNRDTWSNEAVSQTISTNFLFWQVYDDAIEGKKVCTFYRQESVPMVLILDPITGQKMHSWSGMVEPERLLEGLVPFLDAGPKDYHITLSNKRPRARSSPAKTKGMKEASAVAVDESKDTEIVVSEKSEPALPKRPTYPALPEEPNVERNLLCRVGVRFPDGCRAQRNFLRTDPIQLLWPFISAQLGEDETKAFRLTQTIPRPSKILDFESNSTFEESGLANSMISVTWE